VSTAVELTRRGGDVTVISQSAWGGRSACSGSDKQTIHTANTADQGDNFKDMARAIRAGGAMNGDTADIEALVSARAMASLQFLGLPLPQDPLDGTLRYQTDHEAQAGRRVAMDFIRNPVALDLPFGLDRLDADVSSYLQKAGAVQALPIDRLRHMNPLSIKLYRRYKVD